MSDEGFLRAILDEPDDGAHRLVYADWLEERGESERAELIRAECRLERLLADRRDRRDRRALESRARQLLCISDGVMRWEGNLSPELEALDARLVREHGPRWARPLKELVGYWGFRGGFVEEVGMSGRQFLAHAGALFGLAPIRHVSFSKVPPAFAPALAASPFLARPSSLSLAHNRIGPGGARLLADSRFVGSLTALDLTHCHVGDAGLRALLSSPRLTRLVALDLWNNDLSGASADLLAEAPASRRLEYLAIGCNRLGEAGERVLSEQFGDRVTFGLYGEER
jgi:uncharacterized protein (TIGR02996 family)